jgi:hypothetical protein
VALTSIAGSLVPAAVYDLTPAPGEPMQFGFVVDGASVFIDTSVRTGGDYGLTASIGDLPNAIAFAGFRLTFWGLPADPRHDALRGSCLATEATCPAGTSPVPLVTLPTACGGLLQATIQSDSWQEPGVQLLDSADVPEATGCNRLGFEPAISVTPSTSEAEEPSGYAVDVRVPQSESPSGLAAAELENMKVVFPAGTSLSLAGANGLAGCGEAQIALQSSTPGTCPSAARVGTVEIDTPLLPEPLEGAVYLAAQNANPFGALMALYVEAWSPGGVLVKLAGELTPDPFTGQLTLAFNDMPQLPFSAIELAFAGGPQALLANPRRCGPAGATSYLTPWSSEAQLESSSSFEVTWDGMGAACPSPLPFEPSLSTEMVNPAAGGYSPLTLTVSRGVQQQYLVGLNIQLPPGLTWMFSSVPACGEPQAAQGTCPSASQIGSTTFTVGAGSQVLSLPGLVYLTEGHRGAPYGLSIAIHLAAGPLNLGEVILRAAVGVDPGTGALTIASDPLLQIVDGIPLPIRTFNLTIDRFDFVLNPTTCAAREISATIDGSQGAAVKASESLVTPGCHALPPPASPTVAASTLAGGDGGGGRAAPRKATLKPSISHIARKLSGRYLLLSFTTSAAGLVTISGRGIRECRRHLRAGAHELEIALNGDGVFDRHHHRPLGLKLTLKTAGGSASMGATLRM